MAEDDLLIETNGAVCFLTLDRPAKRNGVNAELIHAPTDVMRAMQVDDAIAVAAP